MEMPLSVKAPLHLIPSSIPFPHTLRHEHARMLAFFTKTTHNHLAKLWSNTQILFINVHKYTLRTYLLAPMANFSFNTWKQTFIGVNRNFENKSTLKTQYLALLKQSSLEGQMCFNVDRKQQSTRFYSDVIYKIMLFYWGKLSLASSPTVVRAEKL